MDPKPWRADGRDVEAEMTVWRSASLEVPGDVELEGGT